LDPKLNESEKILNIGLDDFDAPNYGCTTYVAVRLIEFLEKIGEIKFLDYPLLIRLNPNIPSKTRGNGAIALKIYYDDPNYIIDEISNFASKIVNLKHPKTSPVIVFKVGKPGRLYKLYQRALKEYVPRKIVYRIAEREKVKIVGWRGKKGLVGALAAIGAVLKDYTFELLAYRKPGTQRKIDYHTLKKLDLQYSEETYGNVDYTKHRVLITPRGDDPVYFGIRGDNPEILLKIFHKLRTENIERWAIFKTNQGTGVHFSPKKVAEVRPYDSVCIRGLIVDKHVGKGGDIFFKLKDSTGILECAIYKETGFLNSVGHLLDREMIVEACGGIRPGSSSHSMTLNVETLHIIRIYPKITLRNPVCPCCGARMKSLGFNKGFKCKKCGFKSTNVKKSIELTYSILEPGVYLPSPRAYRHLTLPKRRFGKRPYYNKLISPWHG